MPEEKNIIELESMLCCECDETHLFRLKNKDQEFILGLEDILKCLWLASEVGAVPKLSYDWWIQVESQHSKSFSSE